MKEVTCMRLFFFFLFYGPVLVIMAGIGLYNIVTDMVRVPVSIQRFAKFIGILYLSVLCLVSLFLLFEIYIPYTVFMIKNSYLIHYNHIFSNSI